ncbi:type II toxin-antitoxin system VapC family toxin [Nesterenkonia aerolata]|uniref:Type II toxin-antitoxin system VapC family toxin n=1 Tax=Nesterenkonia aerolata TaxID=3074079 RepID=A0ABU2DNW4_9MICC|nr:type II toxin-antitoxin system VapC family toxin [Nesterenkonia sp. LY-0111]MDR8018213.1 type II toxin-antitoxin system VapC family toxin [Nesterenkonia sp. LY-0111]
MLLDTNALLWVHRDADQLGQVSRRMLTDGRRVWFSAVSVAEITIKHMLGRLALPGEEDFPEIFRSAGLQELPLTAVEGSMMMRDPGLVRHDPFDRMLLAQARAQKLELLTSDAVLLGLGHSWILDARR